MTEETQRLAKAIAQAGRASRRDAEKLIEAGRVKVNGKLVLTPAFTVSMTDKVEVDDEVLAQPPLRLWLYHKPLGLVTTARDEKGRRTIYDALPNKLKNVNTVGRLDINSEGLLLLTNHGGLKRTLELPDTGWRRKYRVRAYGKTSEAALEKLRAGTKIDGVQYRPMEIIQDREKGDNAWYTVSIREGKNREIRRLFEDIGLQVNRLIRVSYGPFQLGAMEKGEVSEMSAKGLRTLLGGLIPEGVEFPDAPMDLADEVKMTPARKGKPAQKVKQRSSFVQERDGRKKTGVKPEQAGGRGTRGKPVRAKRTQTRNQPAPNKSGRNGR